MKLINSVKYLGFFACMAWLTSCSKSADAYNEVITRSSNSIAGKWKVVSYNNLVTSAKILKDTSNTFVNENNNGDVTFTFIDDSTVANYGHLNGRTVTNVHSGGYKYMGKYGITFFGWISTLAQDPEWGRLCMEYIGTTDSFAVDIAHLNLFDTKNKRSIHFEKF